MTNHSLPAATGDEYFRRWYNQPRPDNPISDIASIFNALEIHPLRDTLYDRRNRIAIVDRSLGNLARTWATFARLPAKPNFTAREPRPAPYLLRCQKYCSDTRSRSHRLESDLRREMIERRMKRLILRYFRGRLGLFQ